MQHTAVLIDKFSLTPANPLVSLFQRFFRMEAASGILLIISAVIAMTWANSPWAAGYTELWQTKFTIGLGEFGLSKPLLLWINDGLMAIFFFVVGLEIKREVQVGELSSVRQAVLPIAAAVGGMVVPALIYIGFNSGLESVRGWGIPMATDIAFALGILALVGSRAPVSLKIFLTALAIVDDIGAVLVIALFYTAEIAYLSLAVAGGFLALLVIANRLSIRHPIIYVILGVGLWVAFLKSGIHATVAGVLLAMTIPSKSFMDTGAFVRQGRYYLDRIENCCLPGSFSQTTKDQRAAIRALEANSQKVESPLHRLEHALHPWVAFAIMPIFALANAGVTLQGDWSLLASPVALGIIAGLVAGKPLGIMLAVWLVVKTKLAVMPTGAGWRQVFGVSALAGIGFTMSLFVAGLAFGDTPLLDTAKFGILSASLLAGLIGWLTFRVPTAARSTAPEVTLKPDQAVGEGA
jgi:NhaA family Na+:H+ antiporter